MKLRLYVDFEKTPIGDEKMNKYIQFIKKQNDQAELQADRDLSLLEAEPDGR